MAATYEPIATTTITTGGVTTEINFTSIASTWTDLRIVVTGAVASDVDFRCQLNSDSGSNYSGTYLYGDGASAVSGRNTSATYIHCGDVYSAYPWLLTLDIFSYAGSTYKTLLITNSADQNGSGRVWNRVSLWRSTSAVTSIRLYAGQYFNAGFTATLYGIKAA